MSGKVNVALLQVTVKPKLSADAKGAIVLKKPDSQICCTIDSAKKGLTLHFRFNIEAQALVVRFSPF